MNVFFHNSAGYKSKLKLLVELCFLSEGSRGNPSLTLLASGGCWQSVELLSCGSITPISVLSSHSILHCVSLRVCIFTPPPRKDTSHWL